MLDFKLRVLQLVSFQIDKNTTRQILNWKLFDALGFELKVFRLVRFWKKFAFEESRFGSIYSLRTTYFAFLYFFKKHDIEVKFLQCVMFSIEKKLNALHFQLKFFNRVSFWIRKISFCQFLN